MSTSSAGGPGRAFWRGMPPSGRVALVVVLALWAIAAVSPLVSRRATEIRLDDRLLPPSASHPFGTDDLGRDLFARVVAATPLSLAIGLTAAAVSLVVGFVVGSLAGYLGGAVDLVLSRLIEVVLCFPVPFLLLALAAFLPPSPATVILAIGLTTWPGDARSFSINGFSFPMRMNGATAFTRCTSSISAVATSLSVSRHVFTARRSTCCRSASSWPAGKMSWPRRRSSGRSATWLARAESISAGRATSAVVPPRRSCPASSRRSAGGTAAAASVSRCIMWS